MRLSSTIRIRFQRVRRRLFLLRPAQCHPPASSSPVSQLLHRPSSGRSRDRRFIRAARSCRTASPVSSESQVLVAPLDDVRQDHLGRHLGGHVIPTTVLRSISAWALPSQTSLVHVILDESPRPLRPSGGAHQAPRSHYGPSPHRPPRQARRVLSPLLAPIEFEVLAAGPAPSGAPRRSPSSMSLTASVTTPVSTPGSATVLVNWAWRLPGASRVARPMICTTLRQGGPIPDRERVLAPDPVEPLPSHPERYGSGPPLPVMSASSSRFPVRPPSISRFSDASGPGPRSGPSSTRSATLQDPAGGGAGPGRTRSPPPCRSPRRATGSRPPPPA